MLIVTANCQDQLARDLVSRWSTYRAGLLTCTDLSTRGWHYRLHATSDAVAVVAGQPVPLKEITGVYTRLPRVFAEELTQIVPEERPYVAEEMTAFLLSWLASLRCPVINRPTPTCLAGPYWRKGQWIFAAARVGIPVCTFAQRSNLEDMPEERRPEQLATVTVIGGQCFGRVDRALSEKASLLAALAKVDLLEVQFSGPEPDACFVEANPWPELVGYEVEDAVLRFLQGEKQT